MKCTQICYINTSDMTVSLKWLVNFFLHSFHRPFDIVYRQRPRRHYFFKYLNTLRKINHDWFYQSDITIIKSELKGRQRLNLGLTTDFTTMQQIRPEVKELQVYQSSQTKKNKKKQHKCLQMLQCYSKMLPVIFKNLFNPVFHRWNL